MRSSPVALFSRRPRERAVRIALVVAAAMGCFWVFDATLDAYVLGGNSWLEELLYPTGSELFMRFLLAVLLAIGLTLRQESARLRLLSAALGEAPDAIQITDLRGHIAWSNRAVEEVSGYTPAEARGLHVDSMSVDPDVSQRVLAPALRRAGRWTGEVEVKHKDGRAVPVWLTAALVSSTGGKPLAAVGIARDITEKKRAEDELQSYARRLEEATRLKDLFADILRHDLLGPVATLRMTLDLLARRVTDPGAERLLGQARRSCARLTDLVEHAARYAKISSVTQLDLEERDLRAVLEEVVADFDVACQEQHAQIALTAPRACPLAASRLVGEIFANLVSNAMKYGPEGGTVTVDVEDGQRDWVVAVGDRGPGIPDEDKQRIFTRFERLERGGVKGTGLGLAIAKHVVELHRGRIWVEDNPGGGSLFRVALPKPG